eukprot:CAMPEP_0171285724 /NCGR_PEP_ID=MMETSP0790-20130122/68617_1 /TAXON_ID=2925 /ORGANISM="Alexandrium catenella, Strain OF101" /LENGTH=31 /DNA_ID= /DNA_START= /DNA_END= /DNA_ORIENTATION=
MAPQGVGCSRSLTEASPHRCRLPLSGAVAAA